MRKLAWVLLLAAPPLLSAQGWRAFDVTTQREEGRRSGRRAKDVYPVDRQASPPAPAKTPAEGEAAPDGAAPARQAAPSSPIKEDSFTFDREVQALAFDPTGRYAAARGKDGEHDWVKVWDVQDRRMLRVLDAGFGRTRDRLAFGPDALLASGYGSGLRVWDFLKGLPLRDHEADSAADGPVALSPDGALLAGAAGGGRLLSWPARGEAKPRVLDEWPKEGRIEDLAFHPDGRWLAAAGNLYSRGRGAQAVLYDAATGARAGELGDPDLSFERCAFSANGQVFAAGGRRWSEDRSAPEVVFWHTGTWKKLLTIRPESSDPEWGAVLGMAFSPDGLYFATVTKSAKAVELWDLRTGRRIARLPGVDVERHGALAFSPNGKLFAAGSFREVKFWRTEKILPKAQP